MQSPGRATTGGPPAVGGFRTTAPGFKFFGCAFGIVLCSPFPFLFGLLLWRLFLVFVRFIEMFFERIVHAVEIARAFLGRPHRPHVIVRVNSFVVVSAVVQLLDVEFRGALMGGRFMMSRVSGRMAVLVG